MTSSVSVSRQDLLDLKKLMKVHGGLCSCFCVEVAESAGMRHLLPLCRMLAAGAGGEHHSIAVANDMVMLVPDDDGVGRVLKKDDYDLFPIAIIRDHLKPGMVAVDVGANCGPYTLPMAQAVGPTGAVVAVEPYVPSVTLLGKNVRLYNYRHCSLVCAAAGDVRGPASLFLNDANCGDHTVFPKGDRESVACDVMPLDDILDSILPGRPIDLIKIDVQGYEARVLRGAARTIGRSGRMAMLIEIWPEGLREAGSHEDEILDAVESMGFSLHIMDLLSHRLMSVTAKDIKAIIAANLTPLTNVLADIWCVR